MNMREVNSWGNYPRVTQAVRELAWRDQDFPNDENSTLLAHGQGRSYGDVALNEGGTLLLTAGLDRFIHFDAEQGILCAESGVTLAKILELIVPRGWFLPVTPGTRYVSLGGAVANDVHGKNHHQAGTFGCYVRRLALRRSSGETVICSSADNAPLFHATIGGLGLTGLILWVEFNLKRIESVYIDQETHRFSGLEEFFRLSAESGDAWEYTVAWVDCLAGGNNLGRGVFFRGRHAAGDDSLKQFMARNEPRLGVPLNLPGWLLNRATVKAFNTLYFHVPRRTPERVPFVPFFYPLDKLANWNRLYGRRGFFQFQCVVPHATGEHAVHEMLATIARSGQGSFLSVLKVFGDMHSPGLLSFPRSGTTLALDFPNRGARTQRLLHELNTITLKHAGAVYPAKDASMSAESFQQYYPNWREFSRHIDPAFSSSFWRRVTQQETGA